MTSHELNAGMQTLLDYASRSDGNPVYMGVAPAGTATDATDWVLYKFTYDGSNRMTAKQLFRHGAWDSRTGYTYA